MCETHLPERSPSKEGLVKLPLGADGSVKAILGDDLERIFSTRAFSSCPELPFGNSLLVCSIEHEAVQIGRCNDRNLSKFTSKKSQAKGLRHRLSACNCTGENEKERETERDREKKKTSTLL